jgi:hypothetical protein
VSHRETTAQLLVKESHVTPAVARTGLAAITRRNKEEITVIKSVMFRIIVDTRGNYILTSLFFFLILEKCCRGTLLW